MKQTLKLSWVLIALLAITVISSCKKDDDDPKKEVIAGFTYTIDAENSLMVSFTSTSQNATSLSWDFGDGGTSTETNPTHTYTAAGEYQVKLTATGEGGTDQVTQPLSIVNANELLTILTGGTEKTWKLLRDVSTGRYPLECGPEANPGEIWWAMGRNNDELGNRPCMLNDEWVFKANGDMVFDAKGDYWGETGVFADDLKDRCNSTDDMRGPNGEDLSAWNNGTHQWSIDEGNLTVTGLGAFIGLQKIGTDLEVKLPQESVTYKITKLSEGSTDTLALETTYDNGNGHWRVILVHYDNPNDEPPLVGPKPVVNFDLVLEGSTITLTNNTTNATSYLWDFGDNQTSTELNPTHTYTTTGAFNITLTATNANGSGEGVKMIFLGDPNTLTDALLQGGAWKIRNQAISVFVGSTLGNPDWWQVPYADMQPGGGWACIMDDEFIFSAGGAYEYKTNGGARNDGYKGQAAGCYLDSELATQDFPFKSAIHSWVLNTDGERPYIVLTNGASEAAFVGFYKGWYGGENDANSTAPNGGLPTNRYEVLGYGNNGTNEFLFLTVDLNGDAADGASWSVILER